MVYVCKLDKDEIKKFSSLYFRDGLQDVTDFRFSKKESAKSGDVWSDKSDFINKIITVGNVSKEINGISFDYQYHYYPPQSDIRDKIEKFLNQCKMAFNDEILKKANKE